MTSPLFPTYSQAENRITAAILAVFERLSFALVENILQALCQEPEAALLEFRNQPPGANSTPDGRIHASFAYWLEVKRVRNGVDGTQICNHLKALDEDRTVKRQRLLVLTPDVKLPGELLKIHDERLAWASFDDLLTAIQRVAGIEPDWAEFDHPAVTEQEKGLLRELARLLISEGLVGDAKDRVVVVAARRALPEYLAFSAYVCQPDRSFQPSSHIAFYANGKIDSRIPAILETVEDVALSEEGIRATGDLAEATRLRLLDLAKRFTAEQSDRAGARQKVMLLSAPDSPQTVTLPHDVTNDLTAESGRLVAFTQMQRYVPLSALKKGPKTTSQLASGQPGQLG